MKYGAILQACRERAGLSQEQIAEMLHRSRSCISKLENDKKVIDLHTLCQWIEATGAKEVMVAFFMGFDGLAIMQNIMSMFGGLTWSWILNYL